MRSIEIEVLTRVQNIEAADPHSDRQRQEPRLPPSAPADGKPPADSQGGDVDAQGYGTVREQRTYQLIRQVKPITERLFEIEFLEGGVEAFDFTFG